MITELITGLTLLTTTQATTFCEGVLPHFVPTIELIESNIEYQKDLEQKAKIKELNEALHKSLEEQIRRQEELQQYYDNICYYNPNDITEVSNISKNKINELLKGSAFYNDQTVVDAIFDGERKETPVNALITIGLIRLESGHGYSNLATSRNNTSGMKSRGGDWASYSCVGDSVRDTTRLLSEHYLNPNDDFYYNGTSLWNVRTKYCQDRSNWEGSIISVIESVK